jgi:hypothetical protein
MKKRDNEGAAQLAQTPPPVDNAAATNNLNLSAYRRARRKHANQEAYWAGRNRAARRSTRAAA